MRKIIAEHTLIDTDGIAWDAVITVPWPDREKSHGPEEPQVTVNTPNDPEHWAYGDTGPTFDLSDLRTVLFLAERGTS